MSRRKRYKLEEIINLLREAGVRLAQGEKVRAICRSLGISEQSYYRWRRDYGGLTRSPRCAPGARPTPAGTNPCPAARPVPQ